MSSVIVISYLACISSSGIDSPALSSRQSAHAHFLFEFTRTILMVLAE